MNAPYVKARVHGSLAGCPIIADIGNEAGSLSWHGQLRIEHKTLHELVQLEDDPLDPVLLALLDELDELVKPISATLDVQYARELLACSLSLNWLTFRTLRRGRSLAFALKLDGLKAPDVAPSSKLAPLWKALGGVRETLQSRDMFLAYRQGDLSLHEISSGIVTTRAPWIMNKANWLLVGKYPFRHTPAGKAIKHFFGGSGDLELIASYGTGEFDLCLAIPAVDTKCVDIDGLYLRLTVNNKVPRFQFQGDFRFRLNTGNELTLTTTSSFSPTSFLLSAEVNCKQSFKFPHFGAVSFDNAALLFGTIGGGFALGFLATFHIRDFLLFGALILNVQGSAPVPMLVSGAVGRLSIPALYKSFTGNTLDGLDALDMINLDGIKFSAPPSFDVGLFAKADTDAIATFFNAHVDHALALQASDIQIRQHDGGYSLVDRQRMRHYFIDDSGVISLRAQFYYALPGSIQLGSFVVSPGLFLAGTINVFDKEFALLFSIREGDGLLAFARVASIKIGRALCISGIPEANTKDPIPLPDDDLLRALVPVEETGPVFYLSASKREVKFYFDGTVELFGIFTAKARVNYAAKQVSIYVATEVFGVHATVTLDASYENFLSAKLRVGMSLDTKGLTERLGGVTKAIDGAISALTKAVNNAQESLEAAQERVNALSDELVALDDRIKKCSDAIKKASASTRLFVAIAKGLEKAVYEVAKAAVWTAMKAATAILTLAKQAVTVFGNLGKDVLAFVNTAIKSASSLFFIRHIEIEADIASEHQAFKVDVAFVALGKLYTKQYDVEGDVLRNRLLPFIQEKLLGLMSEDLDNLEKGRLPEPVLVFSLEAIRESEDVPDIKRASATIDKASRLFSRMFARYRQNFGEDLSDFDALQTSFLAALDMADHAMDTATKAMPEINAKNLRRAIKKKRGELSRADLKTIDAALAEVDVAAKLQDHVDAASTALANARNEIELSFESTQYVEERSFAAVAAPISEVAFLEELQADVMQTFADEPDAGYIDLAQEPKLAAYFDEALIALGSTPAPVDEARVLSFGALPSGARPYRPRL